MRRFQLVLIIVSFLIPVAAPSTQAQVATGIQPLGSYGGGPVDAVDLANLNVHLDIPIRSKAGRGLNFTYALGYDTAVWSPAGNVWTPAYNFGWTAETEAATGYVTATVQLWKCFSGRSWYFTNNYSGWIYVDKMGTPHPFSLPTLSACPTFKESATGTATDGSGYQINASPGTGIITDAGGHTLSPPFSTGTGPGTAEDFNGNEITFNGTSFTDTLGQTALTISGTNPTDLSYTAPSGGTAEYVVSYSSYTVRTNFGCSGITEYNQTGVSLVNKITLPDGTYYQFNYEYTPGYSSDVTGRLASVKLPTGGTIYYSYSGGSNGITCADGSTATLTRTTPDGAWTYAHTESGTAWTTTVTDPANEHTTLNFQDYFQNTATYQARSEYETERQVHDSSNNLIETVVTCYNGNTSNCNTTAVTTPINERTSFVQWPDNLESETDTHYNNYGLPIEDFEYAYGTNAVGSLQRQTITSYASLGNDIQNRPQTIKVEDGQSNIVSETQYQYDQTAVLQTSGTPQHAAISGSRGNPTTITYTVSSAATLSRTFTYFDTGNVDVATDINGAQSSYTYGDCGNSFPTSVNEPLGFQRQMTWNCLGGVQLTATDENSQTTTTSYTDPYFWRPNSTTDQENYTTNITYTGETSVESTLNFGSSTSDVLSTVDGLGRPELSQAKEAPGSGTYDSVQAIYDSVGRVHQTTLPYPGGAGVGCSQNCYYTTTSYDALARPLTMTDAGGGTVSYSYIGNTVTQTLGPPPGGENTKSKLLTYDALGRLTSVCEITSASGSSSCGPNAPNGYLTTYTYDALGDLTGVSQDFGAQTRSYAYDGLGRMTSEINPESGTTTYTFDTNSTCGTSDGDLVKKTDALGNVTCYAYDQLHHLLTATVESGPYASVTPVKNYVYGPATGSVTIDGVAMANAKTRVAEAYTCFSPCSSKVTDEGFSFTARGELSDTYESTPHSSGYYHVTGTYWANGAVDQLGGVPALPSITYGVDGEGRPSSASASSGQNPLTTTTYSTASLPLQVTLGSGDSDSYAYDPNTERMTQYKFTVNGSSLTGNLSWNQNGTLGSLAITDPFNSGDTQSCTYTHDDLARIASANCGSAASQTFSYDSFGNIEKSGNPYSFQPTYSSATNQMTSIGGQTPSYDANGDVTNDFLNQYSWDANGRPVTVANSTASVSVTYDALGRMVEQDKSGTYTEIVYAPAGNKLAFMSGQSLSKAYVPLPAGDVAAYNSSGLSNYHHADWLGSFRLASTPSRTVPYDTAYAPFGELYAQSGGYTAAFTGQTQDTTSTVYDFPAREYGIQGRWPSPDPAGAGAANPADPQTWNQYAYVRNSPLGNTDPAGTMMRQVGYGESGGGGMLSGYSGFGFDGQADDPPGLLPPGDSLNPGLYAQSSGLETIYAFGVLDARQLPVLTGGLDQLRALVLDGVLSPPTIQTSGGGGIFIVPGGEGVTETPGGVPGLGTASPQTTAQTTCSTGSPNNHLSMGDQVDAASVNPFTSRGGGIWGGNRQSFPATTNNYTYSGKGLGVDVGVSVQSAWAWGSGSWSGSFHSVNWSIGVFSGSIFWTPGKGGWTGLSFGLGLGLPGVAYEQTNYTCKSGPG